MAYTPPGPKLRIFFHQICCSWGLPWAWLVQSIGDLREFWVIEMILIGVCHLRRNRFGELVAFVIRSGTAYNHLIDTKPSLR